MMYAAPRLGFAPITDFLSVVGVRVARPFTTRVMFLAAIITVSVSAVLEAEDSSTHWTQDWVPAILRLPVDAEFLSERSIGSSVRMFTVITTEDADTLLLEWEEALKENGYRIDQSRDDKLDRSIEFSGSGISNAKIIVPTSTSPGPTTLKFDATLR